MAKKSTVQQIVGAPYWILKTSFFLTGRGLRHTFVFINKDVLPRVNNLLTSDDGLASLSPTVSFGGRVGLMGGLTYSKKGS